MTASLPHKKIIFALLSGFLLLPLFTLHSHAQQNDTPSVAGNIGIQISAPIYNFEIKPGSSAQEIIKVRNVSDTPQTFYPEILDFKPIGETGAPQFILKKGSDSYTYSLASWIQVSKDSIKLKPNESNALNFVVTVPKNAEPGGRYAGILFGTKPPDPGAGQVAISNKVGSLILVTVAGDAKQNAVLTEFKTDKTSYNKPPVDFIVRVENKGNIHIVPKGTIEIKDTFGRKAEVLNVNAKNGNILPESIRKFDKESDNLSWNPGGFTIGRFTATLTLNYGDPSQTLTKEVSFWVIPWVHLAITFIIFVILLLILIFAIKRYNKFIVDKATRKKDSSAA